VPAPPDVILEAAIGRLSAVGASTDDQRDALAILSLIAAGFDPEKVATSRNAAVLSAQLGLDLAGWPRVLRCCKVLVSSPVLHEAGGGGSRRAAQILTGSLIRGAVDDFLHGFDEREIIVQL
jgi:hypothetical protein